MLNKRHTAAGFGFFCANGMYYCVQLFSNTSRAAGSLPKDRKFIWRSSAPKVATVDVNGNVKVRKAGKVTITATPKNGKQKAASIQFTIKGNNTTVKGDQKVTSVSIDKYRLYLRKGEKAKLTATALPVTASNRKITWGSTQKSVATVNQSGEVTAVGAGEVWIQAISNNGMRSSCWVTVY